MSLLLLFLLPPFIMCWLNGMYLAERRNHIDIEEDPLCSCEYMKTDQEGGGKGHLLDCTDDYERMDEFCGTCCTRREGVRLLLILENHCIRVPWLGGEDIDCSPRSVDGAKCGPGIGQVDPK